MKYIILSHLFAATYDCGTYGSGNFNDSGACGSLAATGSDVFIGIGVGVVLIVLAVVIILRNRKKK